MWVSSRKRRAHGAGKHAFLVIVSGIGLTLLSTLAKALGIESLMFSKAVPSISCRSIRDLYTCPFAYSMCAGSTAAAAAAAAAAAETAGGKREGRGW